MKKLILLLFSLCCVIPGLSFAAAQDIHIEWTHDYQPVEGKTLAGYHLYKEGAKVCSTNIPENKTIDCVFESESGTFDFTITAFYSDGSESLHSPPYSFELGTLDAALPIDSLPVVSAGSHSFTFSWETDESTENISGYRIYLNNTQLCESTDPIKNETTCNTDLLSEVMNFTVSTLYTDNTESAPSNLLRFDPTKYPQLQTTKLLSFSWDYPAESNHAGFKIYQNNIQICETLNPADRQITCTAEINSSIVTFAISAIDLEQNETTLSNILTYTAESPPETTELLAVITTNTTEGPAPLTVSFDGGNSTGTISSFSWSFGDGATGETSTIDHQYTIPGTYNAKLTVTDLSGTTSSETIAISVTEGLTVISPPIAVISSSTALGQAPLDVYFNGEGSTAPNSTISLYHWDFGDGATATGVNSSHIFPIAGTFTTTLTVTNSEGLTDSISTPIIVTSPPQEENLPPQAIFSATPTSGNAPLTVTFDASATTDPDGTITNYAWQFGDGSSGSGVTATHTYTNLATFTATLLVTDNAAAQSSFSTTITVAPETITPDFNIELGEISVNSNWARVEIITPFQNPIVIAGPPTSGDSEPCVVRLQNISPTGFDIKLDEWDYLDNIHGNENVSYIVMEKGRFTLSDGTQVEAGNLSGTTSFKPFTFTQAFNLDPVVISTVASNNETDTISGRIRNTSKTGFEYYFHEQEKNSNTHVTETINFIAWEKSTGTMGNLIYEVQATPSSVTHSLYDIAFQSDFTMQPLFLTDMQTTNGADTAATRLENPSTTGIQVKIEEEQSNDDEIDHAAEAVGYLAIGSTEETAIEPSQGDKQFTFTWEYDTEAQDVTGFRFYLNNTLLCETNTSTDRTLACTASLLSEVMSFTMTAVDSSGTETMPSNLLTFDPAQFPQLAPTRKASFTWEFDQAGETDIIGFAIIINDRNVCEINDPTARQLTCEIDTPQAKALFSIQAIKIDNTNTGSSNVLTYTP